MGGTNPYISKPDTEKPTNTFRITIESTGQEIVVDPSKIPYGETGLPGSLLDILLGNGVDIDHACGGVCACSTCHLYVLEGLESCSEATEEEQDMVDMAPAIKTTSRLACQCVPNGKQDLKVSIPNWNRNQAREGKPGG